MMMDRLTPQEIERLLEGHSSADPKLARLSDSLQAMRETYSAPVRPEVKAQHVQAMMAAFGETSSAPSPFRRPRRARLMKRAAVAVGASVLLGGSALAATGSLPAPAQDALAKAAHGVGIDLPHSTAHPTPRASSLPGPQFAAAKKAWLDCVKEKGKDACGPKPMAQDFVKPSPKASHEPGEPKSTEPSEHGVGNPHHSPTAPRATPNPGHGGSNPGNGSDNVPVRTPNANSGDSGHGNDDLKTPQPVKTPHV